MVTVAMSAMMRNNPTRITMLKVTMSMVTTMATVLHRDLENDWSRFPISTAQVARIPGVLLSSRYGCFLLNRIVRPCMGPLL